MSQLVADPPVIEAIPAIGSEPVELALNEPLHLIAHVTSIPTPVANMTLLELAVIAPPVAVTVAAVAEPASALSPTTAQARNN